MVFEENVLCTPQAADLELTSPPPLTADLPLALGSFHRLAKTNRSSPGKNTFVDRKAIRRLTSGPVTLSVLICTVESHPFSYSGCVLIRLDPFHTYDGDSRVVFRLLVGRSNLRQINTELWAPCCVFVSGSAQWVTV